MADITFKHVKKVYDKGNVVVPDLNLEIKDKEFIVLVGPSGCGKSGTQGQGYCHGIPELCSVSAYDRV